jgi:glycosyltransferase A (GT-A) superfamily protein (DUF2064 family)
MPSISILAKAPIPGFAKTKLVPARPSCVEFAALWDVDAEADLARLERELPELSL